MKNMDKFTNIKSAPKEEEKVNKKVIYHDNHLNLVKDNGWVFIDEPDSICVLPYLVEYNQFLLRSEVVPSYEYREKQEYFLTCISGTLEANESLQACLARELEEEAGISIKDNVVVEFYDSLFKSKTGCSKFHFCFLPLMEYQYNDVIARGDGSKTESLSKTVKIDIRFLNNTIPSDLATAHLLNKMKSYLNIQIS